MVSLKAMHGPACVLARNEQILELSNDGEPSLSVRHLPGQGKSILYVHGSTFPAALSIHYRIRGESWADDLHARGFDVWSFDFPGYGNSDRLVGGQEASNDAELNPGRAVHAERSIERVFRYIARQTGRTRVSIIAHSWGTIPAGLFAGCNPELLDQLVLFGPVAERSGKRDGPTKPTLLVTADHQWQSFQAGVPEGCGSPIAESDFDSWAHSYLETDAASSSRSPPSVEVPAGPDADFAAAWSGQLPYDPSLIRAPTLLVRGEWDEIAQDADVAWLAAAMVGVPNGAQSVTLPNGAHRMHLEENRQALFEAVGSFLSKES
ncbi:MAG TPA: alpha/beta hydrolase [Sphingomicrobium sp.]|nr:alpha/beta hydrolase [Sphingomicrobium sp.]